MIFGWKANDFMIHEDEKYINTNPDDGTRTASEVFLGYVEMALTRKEITESRDWK